MFDRESYYKNIKEYSKVKKKVKQGGGSNSESKHWQFHSLFLFLILITAFLYVGFQVYLGLFPGSKSTAAHITWTVENVDQTVAIVGSSSSMTLDSSGRPQIAYFNSTNTRIKYASYVGGGAGNCSDNDWNCEDVDYGGGGVTGPTSIMIDSTYGIFISYFMNGEGEPIRVARRTPGSGTGCGSGNTWTCWTVDGSGTGSNPKYSALAWNSATGVSLAYYFRASGDLKMARYTPSGGGNCGGGTAQWECSDVDTSGDVGTDVSAFTRGSVMIVSYRDVTNTSLKYAQYVVSGGTGCASTAWTCETVDNTGNVGQVTSIEIRPVSGNPPMISYYDVTNTALRVATYTGSSGNCTSTNWNCEIVDNAADVGFQSDVTIDTSNNYVVAYYDVTNSNIKIAEYTGTGTETTCTGGSSNWKCENVTNDSNTDNMPAVQVNSSNRRYISYASSTGATTTVFKVANAIPNTAPVVGYTADNVIPATQISQSQSASGIVTINFKIKDAEQTTGFTLNSFEYSVNNGTSWAVPTTNADATAGLYVSTEGQNWRNNNGSNYTAATAFASATNFSFKWNTRHADFTGLDFVDQSDVKIRFKANDASLSSTSYGESGAFSVDVLAPSITTATNIVTRPTAGATTVRISAVFVENNPNTNVLIARISGSINYGADLYADTGLITPDDNANLARALVGDDCLDRVTITHSDDFTNTTSSENSSPSNNCAIPYTPSTPGVSVVSATSLRVTVNKHASETGAVQYALHETTTNQFVQTNGTLSSAEAWQVYSSWGGASGTVVTGLVESTIYTFEIKARNPNDTTNAISPYSNSASQTTQGSPIVGYSVDNVIPALQISQATDGSGVVTIRLKLKDANGGTQTLKTFQYSINSGGAWNTPTSGDTTTALYVSSPGQDWRNNNTLGYTAGTAVFGSEYSFKWNTKSSDLPVALNASDISTIMVRFKANDGAQDSTNFGASEAFRVDDLNPVSATATNIATRPSSGATTVSVTTTFTESNPNTFAFSAQKNNAGYNTTTPGDNPINVNTAGPVTQTVTLDSVVDGDDCVTAVRAIHTDDYGNAGTNENTSPSNSCVTPYATLAPTLTLVSSQSIKVVLNQFSAGETTVQYALYEVNTARYVQTNGTLATSASWNTYTSFGGASGVTATNLASCMMYQFKVKARNANDTASTETALSTGAELTTTCGRSSGGGGGGSSDAPPPIPATWVTPTDIPSTESRATTISSAYLTKNYKVLLRWQDPTYETKGVKMKSIEILRDHLPTQGTISTKPLATMPFENGKTEGQYIDTTVEFGKFYQYQLRSVNEQNKEAVGDVLRIKMPLLFAFAYSFGNYQTEVNEVTITVMKQETKVNVEDYKSDILGGLYGEDNLVELSLDERVEETLVIPDEDIIDKYEQEIRKALKEEVYTNLGDKLETEEGVLELKEDDARKGALRGDFSLVTVSQLEAIPAYLFHLLTDNVHAQQNVDKPYFVMGSCQTSEVKIKSLASAVVKLRIATEPQILKSVVTTENGDATFELSSCGYKSDIYAMSMSASLEEFETPEVLIGYLYITAKQVAILETEVIDEEEEGEVLAEEGEDEQKKEEIVQEKKQVEPEVKEEEKKIVKVEDTKTASEKEQSKEVVRQEEKKKQESVFVASLESQFGLSEQDIQKFRRRSEPVEELFGIEPSFFEYMVFLKNLFVKTGGMSEYKVIDTLPVLSERITFKEPLLTDPYQHDRLNEIFCKLPQEGTELRIVNSRLVDNTLSPTGKPLHQISLDDKKALESRYWNGPVRVEVIKRFNTFFENVEKMGGSVASLITDVSSDELHSWQLLAQISSRREMSDLNTWFIVRLPETKKFSEGVAEIMRVLGAEYCRFVPETQVGSIAVFSEASAAEAKLEDYSQFQGYFDAIGVRDAWKIPGGTGKNTKIIDVEGGYTPGHVDHPKLFLAKGNSSNAGFSEHGTAVLGEMCALENDYGVTGIAKGSSCGFVSFFGSGVENALSTAVANAGTNDVIVIEMQATGPKSGEKCTCNCGQFEQIPMEFWDSNRQIIETAVARGISVVAAAGNGSMNLDASRYQGKFDPKVDTGAILVGAGDSENREPHCWTNYGKTVDLQAWGDSVVSTGYGDLSGDEKEEYFTEVFKGTSSATPITAGAVALLKSIYFEATGKSIKPIDLRDILVKTGLAQAKSQKNIGPLPQLKKAIAELEKVSGTSSFSKVNVPKVVSKTPKSAKVSAPTVEEISPIRRLLLIFVGLGIIIVGSSCLLHWRKKM